MNLESIVGLALSALLLVYLAYALLRRRSFEKQNSGLKESEFRIPSPFGDALFSVFF